MAGVFLLLYKSLPGEIGLFKGMSFAFLVWFFRVVMYTASQWIMFKVPVTTAIFSPHWDLNSGVVWRIK
jgi:hypothetical protein